MVGSAATLVVEKPQRASQRCKLYDYTAAMNANLKRHEAQINSCTFAGVPRQVARVAQEAGGRLHRTAPPGRRPAAAGAYTAGGQAAARAAQGHDPQEGTRGHPPGRRHPRAVRRRKRQVRR